MSHPSQFRIKQDADLELAVYTSIAPAREHTLDEVAGIIGCTRERVRQIERDALKKLRFRVGVLLGKEVSPEEVLKMVAGVEKSTTHSSPGLTF